MYGTHARRSPVSRRVLLRTAGFAISGGVLAVGLAACGGSQPATTAAGSASVTAPGAAATTAAAPAAASSSGSGTAAAQMAATTQSIMQTVANAKAKTHIRVSFWGSPDQIQIHEETDKAFLDANPDIGIEYIAIPWNNYRDKLITMVAGGDVPDVMGVDAYWVLNFVERKMLRPLNDLLAKDQAYSSHKVIAGMWPIPDHHEVAGQIYSAVTAESPRILFYNEDMFTAAGLQTPIELDQAGKWDWNAYLDTATKLTKGSGTDKVFGAEAYPLSSWNYNFIHSNGGRVLEGTPLTTGQDVAANTPKKCVITEAPTVEALQFQVDMMRQSKVSPLPQESQVLGGDTQAFLGKKLAMFISGIWSGADLRHMTDTKWAVGPLPKSPKTGYMRTNYKPNATAMPAQTKNLDAGWAYVAYDPIGRNKAEIDKYTSMTAFEEVKQYFLDKSPVKNAHIVFDEFTNNQITLVPLTSKWLEMEKVINDNLTLAVSGEKSVAEATKTIEPQVTALFQ